MKHEKLLTHFRGYLIGRRYYVAQKALDVMLTNMDGMYRKDNKTPTWAHSLAVAAYCRNLPIPDDTMEQVLIVALLHDVVEDTEYPTATLKDTFGLHTWECVKLLTKNSQYVNEKYYEGIPHNPISAIVKGADRMHNLSTMVGVFTPEKITKYLKESVHFVLPMLKLAKRWNPEYNEVYEGLKHVILLQVERELIDKPELSKEIGYESD